MLNIPKTDIPDNCLEPENEDLATIKNFSLNGKVRAAAERMAAKIKRLEALLEINNIKEVA